MSTRRIGAYGCGCVLAVPAGDHRNSLMTTARLPKHEVVAASPKRDVNSITGGGLQEAIACSRHKVGTSVDAEFAASKQPARPAITLQ